MEDENGPRNLALVVGRANPDHHFAGAVLALSGLAREESFGIGGPRNRDVRVGAFFRTGHVLGTIFWWAVVAVEQR